MRATYAHMLGMKQYSFRPRKPQEAASIKNMVLDEWMHKSSAKRDLQVQEVHYIKG